MRAEHFMIRARPIVRSAASLAAAMLCVAPAAATGCTASTVGVSFADYDPFEPGPLFSDEIWTLLDVLIEKDAIAQSEAA